MQVDVIYMLFLPAELFSITACLSTVYTLVLYLINNFILKNCCSNDRANRKEDGGIWKFCSSASK